MISIWNTDPLAPELCRSGTELGGGGSRLDLLCLSSSIRMVSSQESFSANFSCEGLEGGGEESRGEGLLVEGVTNERVGLCAGYLYC